MCFFKVIYIADAVVFWFFIHFISLHFVLCLCIVCKIKLGNTNGTRKKKPSLVIGMTNYKVVRIQLYVLNSFKWIIINLMERRRRREKTNRRFKTKKKHNLWKQPYHSHWKFGISTTRNSVYFFSFCFAFAIFLLLEWKTLKLFTLVDRACILYFIQNNNNIQSIIYKKTETHSIHNTVKSYLTMHKNTKIYQRYFYARFCVFLNL